MADPGAGLTVTVTPSSPLPSAAPESPDPREAPGYALDPGHGSPSPEGLQALGSPAEGLQRGEAGPGAGASEAEADKHAVGTDLVAGAEARGGAGEGAEPEARGGPGQETGVGPALHVSSGTGLPASHVPGDTGPGAGAVVRRARSLEAGPPPASAGARASASASPGAAATVGSPERDSSMGPSSPARNAGGGEAHRGVGAGSDGALGASNREGAEPAAHRQGQGARGPRPRILAPLFKRWPRSKEREKEGERERGREGEKERGGGLKGKEPRHGPLRLAPCLMAVGLMLAMGVSFVPFSLHWNLIHRWDHRFADSLCSCSGSPTNATGPVAGRSQATVTPGTQALRTVTASPGKTAGDSLGTVTSPYDVPVYPALGKGEGGGGSEGAGTGAPGVHQDAGTRVSEGAPRLSLSQVLDEVAGPDRFLIWGSASSVYLDFLENWFVSIDRLGYGNKVLFVAEDAAALRFLLERWPRQTVTGEQLYSGVDFSGPWGTEELEFNSSYYNALVDRRPEYFKALLDLKITFLYNDVDIVWVGDPFPYFQGTFDMWVQEDAFDVRKFASRLTTEHPYVPSRRGIDFWLCTCFMLVRPTPGSKALIRKWSSFLKSQVHKSAYPMLNQPAFNQVRQTMRKGEVAIGVLPLGRFPSGCLYFERKDYTKCRVSHAAYWDIVSAGKTFPVVVHNNYARGHSKKLLRFKKANLWFLTQRRQGPKLPRLAFTGNASSL